MSIVKIALNRPYTFIVLALLILILSPVVILSTPTDIFPDINIPVVAIAWTFTGLNPVETEGRITTVFERSLTTTVDNIEHIESTTVNGTAIVKVYLQPGASIDRANAQITAISQATLRQLPPSARSREQRQRHWPIVIEPHVRQRRPDAGEVGKAVGDQLFSTRPEERPAPAPDDLRPDPVPLPFGQPLAAVPERRRLLL